LLDHRQHRLGRASKQLGLTPKIVPGQIRRANQDAFASFLDRLWNFVERAGERLNVFALQRVINVLKAPRSVVA
jgi:hypothetical protein